MLPFRSNDLKGIGSAFRGAKTPELSQLVGLHEATFLGPWRLRGTAPWFMAATGMPGWWGKTFAAPDADGHLAGSNVLEKSGVKRESVAMTAGLETSPVDGRTDLVVRYPKSAPWPWRNVTDHFRPIDDGVLLGISFGIPFTPSTGAPFLLRRVDETS